MRNPGAIARVPRRPLHATRHALTTRPRAPRLTAPRGERRRVANLAGVDHFITRARIDRAASRPDTVVDSMQPARGEGRPQVLTPRLTMRLTVGGVGSISWL